MKKYILIGTGGFAGAILRFFIERVHIYNYNGNIPLNTLIINVTGSFLLALILTAAFDAWKMDASLSLGITTGFLGAFTTFSTMCKEAVRLMLNGYYFSSALYIVLSVILGLAAAYLGIVTAEKILIKVINKKESQQENAEASEMESEAD